MLPTRDNFSLRFGRSFFNLIFFFYYFKWTVDVSVQTDRPFLRPIRVQRTDVRQTNRVKVAQACSAKRKSKRVLDRCRDLADFINHPSAMAGNHNGSRSLWNGLLSCAVLIGHSALRQVLKNRNNYYILLILCYK